MGQPSDWRGQILFRGPGPPGPHWRRRWFTLVANAIGQLIVIISNGTTMQSDYLVVDSSERNEDSSYQPAYDSSENLCWRVYMNFNQSINQSFIVVKKNNKINTKAKNGT